MSIISRRHWLMLFMLIAGSQVMAAGLDDADARLYKVQLAMAEKGDARAQYFLGEMHEQGLGTQQNLDEAFKWYEKAAEKGDVWARRKLTRRADIEADIKKDHAPDNQKSMPAAAMRKTPENTAKNNATGAQAMVAKTNENNDEVERAKAAEKVKRRAAVRAMILERIRHPVGEPFE